MTFPDPTQLSRAPRRGRTLAVALFAALTLVTGAIGVAAATAEEPTSPEAAPVPTVVTITARDFAFDAPDTVTAGVTTLRLVNRGPELHHVQLIRLDEGHTMGEFFGALKAGGPLPRWAYEAGGPNTPAPGGESAVTLDLLPGRYVVVCFIPSADGMPHIMKGMARELVAVAPRRAAARPVATVTSAAFAAPPTTMTLTDYGFALTAPLTAGVQTIRVRNEAAQPHEVFVVRLAPGKTAGDVVAWVEKQAGPPPGLPLGGTTGIATGGWNDLALDLVPGEYALLCFLPDAKDGKPHVMHGMTQQFTVR